MKQKDATYEKEKKYEIYSMGSLIGGASLLGGRRCTLFLKPLGDARVIPAHPQYTGFDPLHHLLVNQSFRSILEDSAYLNIAITSSSVT